MQINNSLLCILVLVFSVQFNCALTQYELETSLGTNVILPCKSSDDKHNFMFWHSGSNGEIIGPRNQFDSEKFQFEVLTGNLTIRSVTVNDAGVYNCVSDGLDKRDILVRSVKLHIKNYQDDVLDYTYVDNLWKTCAVLGLILFILVMVAVGVHVYNTQKQQPNYFDMIEHIEDEDSAEELFTREPSTSGVKLKKKDNFEKVYTTINNV